MPRTVQPWVGKTDDAKVPAHVRLRIFTNSGGVCHISGRKIAPGEKWELEHLRPLSEGGAHCESNLRPALVEPHKAKTAEEARRRAKADRAKLAHIGAAEPPRNPIKSRGFPPAAKPELKIKKRPLPPRPMYEDVK